MRFSLVALITASEFVLALFIASIVGLWAAAYAQTHTCPVGRLPIAH